MSRVVVSPFGVCLTLIMAVKLGMFQSTLALSKLISYLGYFFSEQPAEMKEEMPPSGLLRFEPRIKD